VTVYEGGVTYRLASLPPTLEPIFGGGVFCSGKCIRLFFYETHEILDAMDTEKSRQMVKDLRKVHHAVADVLAALSTH
jgi:hypothetical protein